MNNDTINEVDAKVSRETVKCYNRNIRNKDLKIKSSEELRRLSLIKNNTKEPNTLLSILSFIKKRLCRNKLLRIRNIKKFHMHPYHLEYSFLLTKKHQLRKYKKKRCTECSGNGMVGISKDGVGVLCFRCVDTYNAFKEWEEYCGHFTDLKRRFKKINKGV